MTHKTGQEARDKVIELIHDIDYAMLCSREGGSGGLHSRPMAFRTHDFDGHLWFFTKKDSRKVRELSANPETLLCFGDASKQNYVSVTGKSDIIDDRAKVKELWTEIYRAWFPGGVEDPNIVLIRVTIEHADYWDAPSSVMVHAYGYLKAVATGKPAKPGDVGTADFT